MNLSVEKPTLILTRTEDTDMRTFLVAVNLPESLWDFCMIATDINLKVSGKIIDLQIDEADFNERTGFDEYVSQVIDEREKVFTFSLCQDAILALAGWDEECDDSVIGFICSEIAKDLT
jgi:hypothetical protein